MRIRDATTDEAAAVVGLFEAALLETALYDVVSLIQSDGEGTVLVAESDGPLLGALAFREQDIEAIAVRPKRRGQGIGSALVSAAADRVDGVLRAEFDEQNRPFYAELGFEIESVDGARYRGRLADSGGSKP